MGDENGGTNALQQGQAGRAVDLLDQRAVRLGLELRGVEGVEDRVALDSRSGPLRVQRRLGPQPVPLRRREVALRVGDRRVVQPRARAAQHRRAAPLRLVDYVHDVPGGQEVRGPALTRVGGVEPVLWNVGGQRAGFSILSNPFPPLFHFLSWFYMEKVRGYMPLRLGLYARKDEVKE